MAILEVEISEGGVVTGHLDPTAFMKAVEAPKRASLSESVERFNAWKTGRGEAARAKVILARHLRKGKS